MEETNIEPVAGDPVNATTPEAPVESAPEAPVEPAA